ncbi:hypothetical protein QUB80_15215 [Chlorogloeopsis sp. ULAP01]|nr:hypothetical protein [Chlorogloeopsis sp. ULAP01]MDM9382051.1 hypothetical protein [Chlorogloeopsis sp. ULAP01]
MNKGEALTTASANSLGSLKVITNEFRTTPFKPSQLSSSQVATNQLWSLSPIVNIWANQLTIPHITTDEVSRQIVALQDGTLQVDITQMGATQVNRSQIDPTQVNSMQDNISEISFPISITLEQLLGIKNFGRVGFNSSMWHNSVAENSPFRGSNTSKLASLKLQPINLVSLKSAPVRLVPVKSAYLKLASRRLVLLKLQLIREALKPVPSKLA